MKLLPPILLVALASACSRTRASAPEPGPPDPPGAPLGVRVEVQSKERMEGADGQVAVRFRVVNGSSREIAYPGFSEDSPTYSLEFQEGDAWSPYFVGWCGTGLSSFTLAPGAEMSFQVGLPGDGKTYRASFGEPPVVTPPVVADAR
jgi:hypothetical protein